MSNKYDVDVTTRLAGLIVEMKKAEMSEEEVRKIIDDIVDFIYHMHK